VVTEYIFNSTELKSIEIATILSNTILSGHPSMFYGSWFVLW